ncbi:hypothetical protein ACMA5K_05755 [Bradyrhizobium diazoefficiens]|uniref:hypothetical protein n=1 Tax=Bradyrhizobium diazoefficiens TaxID=1355477 RepID=UPI0015B696AB|nr:hypothetical protein [Bradyrhizobium diazoefficiens]QLD40520.1 hypothetical protein HUW42_05695 [Bradyrhizobium diazoefficiens]
MTTNLIEKLEQTMRSLLTTDMHRLHKSMRKIDLAEFEKEDVLIDRAMRWEGVRFGRGSAEYKRLFQTATNLIDPWLEDYYERFQKNDPDNVNDPDAARNDADSPF